MKFSLFKDGFWVAFALIYIWPDCAKDHTISISFWALVLPGKPASVSQSLVFIAMYEEQLWSEFQMRSPWTSMIRQ